MILGGDLGGTKTLLALAEPDRDGKPQILREARFDSAAYPVFDDLLAEFLADTAPGAISAACFGLAGPTDGCVAQLTYLPWCLEAQAITERFGIGRVTLINDFAAAANGLALLPPAQIVTIQAGQPLAEAPRVVLGAGTGLGVAGLTWRDGDYRVIPGEGGHMGFSPQSQQQAELWRWLFAERGRVTVEDIVSGPGLAVVYRFLGGKDKTPADIGNDAVTGRDPLAQQALELWLTIYGAFAGDLAMHWLARGGVFLAGGIAAKLLPMTRAKPFVDAFNAKREHREIARAMPVYLITEERLGLLGALNLAAQAG